MKLPKVLIYNLHGTDIYRMINTHNGSFVGQMMAYPSVKNTLEIAELTIYDQRQGYGTAFINFAKKLSEEFGMEQRISVGAGITPYDPFNPPHIFYRKQGFTSDNLKMIKKIDKHIKKGKQLDYIYTETLEMYYPDKNKPESSFWQKFKNFFKL